MFQNKKESSTSAKESLSATKDSQVVTNATEPANDMYTYAVKRDLRLLDFSKLLVDVEVSEEQSAWFERVNAGVEKYMNGPDYDASHDYEHCIRVVWNSHRLWQAEKHHGWAKDVDPIVVYLAALIHDVGDHKYAGVDTMIVTDNDKWKRHRDAIREFIDVHGVPPEIAGPAPELAAYVSYARESHNPAWISAAAETYPALRFVQDADRLDALGAMGITRISYQGGAKEARSYNTILTVAELIDERFSRYPGFMRTETGRKEGERKLAYMVQFKEAMLEQAGYEVIMKVE